MIIQSIGQQKIQNISSTNIRRNLVIMFVQLVFLLAIFSVRAFITKKVPSRTSELTTWWHNSYELNSESPVADNAVRRSVFYDVKIATVNAPNSLFDSFVYMSIPRAGREKFGYSSDDGAEFAADEANLTMSWSSFLYNTDCWVYIHLRGVIKTILRNKNSFKVIYFYRSLTVA